LGIDLLPEIVRANFDVAEHHHACAVLKIDFPTEWADLIAGLDQMRLPHIAITHKALRSQNGHQVACRMLN